MTFDLFVRKFLRRRCRRAHIYIIYMYFSSALFSPSFRRLKCRNYSSLCTARCNFAQEKFCCELKARAREVRSSTIILVYIYSYTLGSEFYVARHTIHIGNLLGKLLTCVYKYWAAHRFGVYITACIIVARANASFNRKSRKYRRRP